MTRKNYLWIALVVAAIGVAGGLFWWRYGRIEALPAYLAQAMDGWN